MVSHPNQHQRTAAPAWTEKDFLLFANLYSPYYYAINRGWVVDRYVLTLFTRTVLTLFTSLALLYVVIDLFGNFQEFNAYGKRIPGGILWVLVSYYFAKI